MVPKCTKDAFCARRIDDDFIPDCNVTPNNGDCIPRVAQLRVSNTVCYSPVLPLGLDSAHAPTGFFGASGRDTV